MSQIIISRQKGNWLYSQFRVPGTGVILILLRICYCIISHKRSSKPTFAPPCTRVWLHAKPGRKERPTYQGQAFSKWVGVIHTQLERGVISFLLLLKGIISCFWEQFIRWVLTQNLILLFSHPFFHSLPTWAPAEKTFSASPSLIEIPLLGPKGSPHPGHLTA